MRRLTQTEIAAYKARLSRPITVKEAKAISSEVHAIAELYTVSQGRLDFWRELFVGISCADLMHASHIRLGEEPPDIVLTVNGADLLIEITNAIPTGRKLGAEYDDYAASMVETGSVKFADENALEDHDSVVPDVAAAIDKKVSKSYRARYVLVVDILHKIIGPLSWSMERAMVRSAVPALTSFEEVWIRKAASILRVSRQGVSRVSAPWPSDED